MTRCFRWFAGRAALVATLVAAPLSGEVVLTTMPSGMVQPPGQATATDRFALTNSGTSSVLVTLTAAGGFFSVSPSSFVLEPAETEVVTVQASAGPAGVRTGTVTVSAAAQADIDVPVKLLITNPPAAPVSLAAVDRVVVSDPPGSIISPAPPPPPVRATFRNPTSAPVTALVVTDAAWIEPVQDFVTLAPGGTASVDVFIDPSKRPDTPLTIGAATGKVSLVFLSGPTTPAGAPIGQLSTVVIHVNKAHVVSGTPPPLQFSDIALFVPGFGGSVDLSLFARGDTPSIRDLRFFYEGSGMSVFSEVPTNLGISFVNLVRDVRSVQIRTPDVATLSLAALRTSTAAGNSYASVLPILISQQGATAGEKIYLTGVAKDATTKTNVHLQEVSGNAASVVVDYLDRNGTVLQSRTQSLSGFESAHQGDSVPAGAITIVISNTGGAGRVAAVALVVDTITGDAWPIRDGGTATAAPAEGLIVAVGEGVPNARTEVHVVNRGSDVALTRLEVVRASSGRRRAVQRSVDGGSAIVISVAPNGATTFEIPKAAGGLYARVAATGGALAASSRAVAPSPAGGRFGSALPVIAASAVLRAGDIRGFAGIEDVTPATVVARTPLTFRSDLMLIETAGEPAIVRLTLRYVISAGLASARALSSRDIEVGAGAFVILRPLAREIIGDARDNFGDLRNMVLTVEVVSGAGRILPVVQTIENHSGDVTIRGQ